MAEKIQNGFESGELDKWCLGRMDDPAYQRGVAWLENFNLIRTGGINRRKGYKYIDKILDIKPPVLWRLDRDDGREELLLTDAETQGEEHRWDSIYGTSTTAVKIIPLSYSDKKNYLVYLTTFSYGYIEFNGYDMVRRVENAWPPPPPAPSANTVQYNKSDPGAYFKITRQTNFSAKYDIAVGTELPIGGGGVMETGLVRVAGVSVSKDGKMKEAAPFSVYPDPVTFNAGALAPLTQKASAIDTADPLEVSYFDEEGAGTGLRVLCNASMGETSGKLSFQVLEGGSGFVADAGKDTTTLRLTIEQIGSITVSATVGTSGGIAGIKDYRVDKYPDYAAGPGVMRWQAPPPESGDYDDIADWYDKIPASPATLSLAVTEVLRDDEGNEYNSEWELGKMYRIDIGVAKPGSGFEPLTTDGQGLPVTFLKIRFNSEVKSVMCARELRVVAVLNAGGGIASVKSIPYWIDDDVAASGLAAAAPDGSNEGGCFSKLMNWQKFMEWGGVAKAKKDAAKVVWDKARANTEAAQKAYNEAADKTAAWEALKAAQEAESAAKAAYDAAEAEAAAAPVKHIVTLEAETKTPVCTWKGYGRDAYSDWEQAALNGRNIKALQEYGGIWYEHGVPGTFWWGISQSYWWSRPTGRNYQKFAYPMTGWGADGSTQKVPRAYIFSMFSAAGCPKPIDNKNKSAQPYLQWYTSGQNYICSYKYPCERLSWPGVKGLDRWYQYSPYNSMDDDLNMYTDLANTEEGVYQVENAGAYKGDGAELTVASAYINPDDDYPRGRLALTVNVLKPGLDYLVRGVGRIFLHLRYRSEKLEYRYDVPIYAARGSDGMLVLRNEDESAAAGSSVTYTIDAVLKTLPPVDGGKVTLSDAEGNNAAADCAVTPVKDYAGRISRWDAALKIPVNAGGEPLTSSGYSAGEKLSASWNASGANYTLSGASRVVSIMEVKNYIGELLAGGKFRTDPKGTTYYGTYNGNPYDLIIADTKFVAMTTLHAVSNPKTGQTYKVLTDEELGGSATYWERDAENKEWVIKAVPVYPESDSVIRSMQYAYTGALLILCASGITPFTLEIGDGGIKLGALGAVVSVTTETTAPPEFDLIEQNNVIDDALPPLFLLAVKYSPSVIGYVNGRLWLAGLPDDPSRIYVSKPNRDRGSAVFDFTTYKLFLTVTPEYTPFEASNELGGNRLAGAGGGVMGLARDYSLNRVTGGRVSFGYDKPAVLATPYFKEGAVVERVGNVLELDAASAPLPNEYTLRAAAELRNKTAMLIGLSRLRVTLPGGFCRVTADCDGFEVGVATGGQIVGLTNSLGPVAGFSATVPYTGWGAPGAQRAAAIASAAGAAAAVCGGSLIAMVGVGSTSAAILSAASAVVDAVCKEFLSEISLSKTDGSSDNPGLDEYGGRYASTQAMQAKCDYLLAKNKLYEERQPFVMRRWKVEEKEYSTADCGFTFKVSSDEKEGVSFIGELRSIFFATDSSERIMPATVDGEAQSAQTGSYYGAEKIQAAKAADAFYFVQKGGQSVLRAYYAPNVPVPAIADVQMYNREILRNRKILSIRSSRAQPVTVWCVMEDGGAAVITDEGGRIAWSRVTCGAGAVADAAVIPINGMSPLRAAAVRAEDGIYIGAAADFLGEKGDVFLDLWREYNNAGLVSEYGRAAVVYDAAKRTAAPVTDYPPPDPGEGRYIGYPYESRMRTLPGATAGALKPGRVAAVRLRLLESHLPFIKGHPSGTVNRMVHPLWGGSEPELNAVKDGVVSVPIPGTVEQDAAFEVYTDVPEPLSVIMMIEEGD